MTGLDNNRSMSHRGMGLTLAQEKRQVSANYGIDETGFFAAGGLLAAAEKDKGIRAANGRRNYQLQR